MRGDESALLEAICDAIRASGEMPEAIAERARVSSASIYGWLSGRTLSPRIITLEKVADALDYEIKLSRGRPTLAKMKSNGAEKKPKPKWWEAYLGEHRNGDG